MPDTLEDLTDKEKEALRLLLAGHDAKSSALDLNISVHTLNDRLRAARRKLEVTTSREAARLLAEAEDTAPQSFVHKPLGIQESERNQDDLEAADRSESGIVHFAMRRKGILIMSFAFALSLAVFAVVPSQGPASNAANTMASDFAESGLQARHWLGLIDVGKFDESYLEAGEGLREQYSLGKWKFGMTLRMTKGQIQKRDLVSIVQTDRFSGQQDGEFEIVTFHSKFEYNNRQSERVVLQRIGNEWKVVDYEITPLEQAAD